ncbi:ABC transporter ATP-binding protein [Thermodesulforhabdus norvegica]|uniref:Peptide/nickel transport system ATP-binding protein n=1 Tax=Thermodesulforhabdus norvegica TaxID=39841 RepID=A0A1I4VRV4_9BACT|nr:ABC transporter ATP-binding protein [Thermodesulforhabdus norvegica]SFN03920.1 peptide/nickel transport system ATP-binding protein [Thermodesulforhabdus norvegica]
MREQNGIVLRVDDLHTYFFTERGVAKAVSGVSFEVKSGEMLALVGESGCGKSVTALSIMRLIPDPPGKIVGGRIIFEGRDLTRLPEKEMRSIRGNKISMVFQEPMTALNPVFPVGDQVAEVLLCHGKATKRDVKDRVIDLFRQVGIPAPERRIRDYPHQMSGGMRQRVVIAMALACRPSLILADEPTTALDVTIQAQILELMKELQQKTGTAFVLITHDLGVVAEMAERVIVMYAGRIVEVSDVVSLFRNPLHPYTQGLMESVPGWAEGKEKQRLKTIPGIVPSLLRLPEGCVFNDRCSRSFDRCKLEEPDLVEIEDKRLVRCWLYE